MTTSYPLPLQMERQGFSDSGKSRFALSSKLTEETGCASYLPKIECQGWEFSTKMLLWDPSDTATVQLHEHKQHMAEAGYVH